MELEFGDVGTMGAWQGGEGSKGRTMQKLTAGTVEKEPDMCVYSIGC